MRWDEIDGDLWSLSSEKTKSGRGHLVPLTQTAQNILRRCPRMKGLHVLSTNGGRAPISGFAKAKDDLDVAIEDWRPHDLRRTCATGMARLGVLNEVVGRVLNHAPPRTVTAEIYNQYDYLGEKRRALELWDAEVQRILERNRCRHRTSPM